MFCPNHETDKKLCSQSIGVCALCVREGSLALAKDSHESLRCRDRLVPSIPSDGEIVCAECGNHCRMREGEVGFCSIREAKNGEIIDRHSASAIVSWYFDPLPTNCVADWVCPVTNERELGFGKQRLKNLAVFYGSCNSDCLFCQNTSYRTMMSRGSPLMTPEELASAADDYTACVCYFGGDPACNPEHSVRTSQILNEAKHVRVCYETNGNISKKWIDTIAEVVRTTKGTLKFDLKAVTSNIYEALTGIQNSVVLRNFESLATANHNREGEFLVASILLVPGYIDIPEVKKISSFKTLVRKNSMKQKFCYYCQAAKVC